MQQDNVSTHQKIFKAQTISRKLNIIGVNKGDKYCMLQTAAKVKQNEAELKINFIKPLFCTTLEDKTKFIMLINCDG